MKRMTCMIDLQTQLFPLTGSINLLLDMESYF